LEKNQKNENNKGENPEHFYRKLFSPGKGVGRKNFQGEDNGKARPKNSTIKPFSTLSVPFMKI